MTGNRDAATMDTDPEHLQILTRFRHIAEGYLSKHEMGSATFWAGQAMCLSGNDPEDVLRLAECFVIEKQPHRALQLIQGHKLESADVRGCYLAAKAAFEAGELDEAVAIMESGQAIIEEAKEDVILKTNPPVTPAPSKSGGGSKSKTTRSSSLSKSVSPEEEKRPDDGLLESRRVLGSYYLLKGRILEAMDNRDLAAEAYRQAVRIDVYCHDAFQALIKHQILTYTEETELLNMMPFGQQCGSEEERELVHFLHEMSLKKYHQPADLKVPRPLQVGLHQNTDLLVAKAERHFYNCDYTHCFKITSSIVKINSFHSECLPIHICCLVELQKSNDLFHLAHRLVDLYPEWVVSWFAVGCYYYMVSRHEFARRYLNKATMLDRVFGPAWLAYGHSFALENEHDQAMAAYFKAFQLMRGCHLPLLYIGVEYGLTNNPKLAEQFFAQALEIAPKDPFVLHEMGVVCYQNHEYSSAEKYFTNAFEQVRSVQGSVLSSKWESLLNNLGHTMRKLGKYEESLEYHQQALVLVPLSYSTYSAIGYVNALQGDYVQAVEAFHKALSLKRDDAFSSKMLNSVIEQLMGEATPYEDYPDEVPKLEPLDPSSIHTPQLRPPFEASTGHRGFSQLSPSSPLNVTSEDDTNNQSNSLDIEMADVTNDE